MECSLETTIISGFQVVLKAKHTEECEKASFNRTMACIDGKKHNHHASMCGACTCEVGGIIRFSFLSKETYEVWNRESPQ